MHCASALSCRTAIGQVADDLADQIRSTQPGDSPDLAVLFVTPHFEDEFAELALALAGRLECQTWLGCTARGISAGNTELLDRPAAALWTVSLPAATVRSFCLSASAAGEAAESGPADLARLLASPVDQTDLLLLLVDGFTVPAQGLLDRLETAYPGRCVVGGLASGGEAIGQNRLLLDGRVLRDGLAGVAFDGPVLIDQFVLPRCRPIGAAMPITRCYGQVIYELAGEAALARLREVLDAAEATARRGSPQGLLAGICPVGGRLAAVAGEFLIRQILAVDPETQAVTVAGDVSEGQMLQFYIPDESARVEALAQMAESFHRESFAPPIAGALLFAGGVSEGVPRNLAAMIQRVSGPIPLAGIYTDGPFATVAGRPSVADYTDVMVIFRGRG